ncbi:MAG: hypothetical protein WCR31_08500 [Treponema sp.]
MHTPVPLLYKNGYLTIKDYNKEFGIYTLEFPNEEVKYGFLNFLLPQATAIRQPEGGFYIGKFVTDIRSGDVNSFMTRLQPILGQSHTYRTSFRDENSGSRTGSPATERTFQTGCFLVFELMGQFT